MVVSARRAREIARIRQDILDAAARALADRGFANATMQDIAREAGYTAASLYSYFSSKEEIIRELVLSILRERQNIRVKEMPGDLSLRQKLEIYLRRQLDFATRHRDAIRFFLLSGGIPAGLLEGMVDGCDVEEEPPSGRPDDTTPMEIAALDFSRFFAEQAKPEELHGWSPEDAGLAFAGLVHGFFLRWLRRPVDEAGDSGGLHTLVEFFVGGLEASRLTR